MCPPAFLSNKSHGPRPADRVFQLPLLFGRCARNATGHDFALLGHEFFQQFGILIVNAVNAFQIPASFFFREEAKLSRGSRLRTVFLLFFTLTSCCPSCCFKIALGGVIYKHFLSADYTDYADCKIKHKEF